MAKHHGRSFRADPGGDWNGTVYDDFVCDTFDVDVSEEYEKIFDLLCAGTDMGKDFPNPCIVHFYDRSGSPAAWYSGDFGSRTFWNMEWSGGAAWSRTDDRLSACCGVIAGIIGTDVSFYGERQFSQRTIWQRDLKRQMRSDDRCFRESWCIGSQRAAWKWREL